MKSMAGRIPWGLIVSMLLTGCYTNSLVSVNEKEGIGAYRAFKDINGVVTKGGTRYVLSDAFVRDRRDICDSAAAFNAADSLVGVLEGKRVALPLSAIAQVSRKEFDPAVTAIMVVGSAAVVSGIVVLVKGICEAYRDIYGHYTLSSWQVQWGSSSR